MESLEAFKSFKNATGTYDIDEESLKEILSKFVTKSKGKTKEKTKRAPSAYMSWLNENRQSIQEKYFSDYDSVEKWEEDTVAQYYKDKGLGEPKKLKKPNMCILVSVKAGQLWKELDDDEKSKYKSKPVDETNEEAKKEPEAKDEPEAKEESKEETTKKVTKVVKKDKDEQKKNAKKVVKKGGKK